MDLAREVRQFGNTWNLAVNRHFETILEPLHAERAPRYNDHVKEVRQVKYGSHDRHRLDVSFRYMCVFVAISVLNR